MKSLQLLVLLLHSCISLSLESLEDARWPNERRDCSSSAEFSPVPNLAGAVRAAMEDLTGKRSSARAALLSEECAAAWQKLWERSEEERDTGTSLGLRAVDSSGKIGAGILDGNVYALGSYDECQSIDRGNSGMQFCIIPVALHRHLNDTTVDGLRSLEITMATCWPEECSLSDMETGLLPFATLQLNQALPGSEFELKMDMDGVEIHCSTGRPTINTGAAVMIVICCTILIVVMISTCVDWLFSRLNRNKTNQNSQPTGSEPTKSETTPITGGPPQNRESALVALITVFSLCKSVPAVLSTAQPANAIKCINGLRVFSMVWVIASATLLWAFQLQHFGMDNARTVWSKVAPQFANQVIFNGFIAVDTFFLIGGFLSSYLTLNKMAGGTYRRRIFVRYYAHRILRLVPTYVFVLFFYWFLTVHLADGPVYELNTGENSVAYSNCQKYWWTNIFYINNLYPWKLEDECMKWSWYLANDVQFYVLAPLIFVPLYWLWPVGLIIAGIATCGSLISSGLAAGFYELDANVFAHSTQDPAQQWPSDSQAIDELIKPYTRVAPYIVGILLGYVIFRKIKLPFNKLLNWTVHMGLWVAAILFCSLVVFGLYSTWHGKLTAAENILYFSFSHLTWSSGVALLIFSCHSGYGGALNRLLSMNIWVPLGRLTFGVYLVHPIVLTVILTSLRSPLHYTFTTAVVYITASVCLSYTAAALLAVVLEFPVANLEATLTHLLGFKLSESVREGRQTSTQPKVHQDVLV